MSAHATAAAPTGGKFAAALPGLRKLTTLPLIAATFFMVSGGPFGLEELIGNAGYAMSMLVLLIVPLVWSLPTALMVSELSSAIPCDGGYYVWVSRGLGPFWGFQEGLAFDVRQHLRHGVVPDGVRALRRPGVACLAE